MNPHSITFPPAPQQPRADHTGLVLVAALIAASIGIGALVALLLAPSPPQVTPVRMPEVMARPLELLDEKHLAEIRSEAFRAGYVAAAGNGCAGSLATPIALTQP